MMNKKHIKNISMISLFMFFTLLIPFKSMGQLQGNLAQYMYDHSIINPAARGSYTNLTASLIIRQQWVGVKGAPKLNVLNMSIPYKDNSIGLSLFQQSIGVHKSFRIYSGYTHTIRLNYNQYLSFGISPGIVYQNSDFKQLSTQSGYDQEFKENYSSGIKLDFQLGLYLFSPKWYLGLATPGLLKNEQKFFKGEVKSISKLNRRYLQLYGQGGYVIDFAYDWTFHMAFMTKYVIDSPLEVDINTQLVYKNLLGGGISYRTPKEYLLFVNYWLNKNIKFGYAFQNTIINKANFNSHEIMLFYSLRQRQVRRARIQNIHF